MPAFLVVYFILLLLIMVIIYYKLEEKYPRLAKWIKLRRKFQHYYIGLNILLISVTLLFVLYVNYTILKDK